VSRQIIDNFLDDFDSFRGYCDLVDFKGELNPADEVFYPGVSTEIPDSIRAEVIEKVGTFLEAEVKPGAMFMRLSVKGVDAPHQAHTDAIMGSYALMLYLNRLDDCLGGTSFVIHKETGLCDNPINDKQEQIWKESTNDTDAWQIMDMCPMVPNRALIFDSYHMHRAEPVGGFGSDGTDGRLVLTFFFDLNYD
jgi:hypothetical protein